MGQGDGQLYYLDMGWEDLMVAVEYDGSNIASIVGNT